MNRHEPKLDANYFKLGSIEPTNRRKDGNTRDAIDAIQELLFDPEAPSKVFKLVLGYLTDMTESDLSVVYVSDLSAENPITRDSKLEAIYQQNDTPFVDVSVLESWVGQKGLLVTPLYYNAPIPRSTETLLLPEQNITAVMILPIILHQELRGIYVLGKRKTAYKSNSTQQLKPVLGAVTCALQSSETVKGNFLGLDQKIANNQYLSSLISSSPVGIIVVNSDFSILMNNPISQQMLTQEIDENEAKTTHSLTGMDIRQFIPTYESLFKWSNQESKYGNEEHAEGPKIWQEIEVQQEDGTISVVDLTIFRYMHGGQRFTTIQIQDTTAMLKSAEEYKEASQQLNALTQLAPVGIIRVDKEWNCLFANEKWFELSGLSKVEDLQQDWINAIHSSEVNDFLEALYECLHDGTDYNQELRLVSPLGTTKWVDFSMRVLFDPEGNVEGFLGTCADITERYITQQKLRHIAEYDGLTGLANRVLFNDRLEQAFLASQRDESVVSVFFLDLDGFKDINDTLGHNVGDLLLQQVAERLVNTLRKNDTVARFGGDEFVVLLGRDNHLTDEVTVAEKVIQRIAEPYQLDKNEVYVTTSLGLARGTYVDSNPDDLLKNADFALYNAKKEGKNKYQIFDQELEFGAKQRINLLNDLRSGLIRERYCLYFQAICNSESSKILGFEALLRFTDKNENIISPDMFIPMLEETGMIIDVGKWVIEETCKQLASLQKQSAFRELGYLTFNVSAKQLLEESFVSHVQDCCTKYNVAPQNLVMEMTESVIINKPEKVKAILEQIRTLGLRIALDDFGTGYSSLSYLQNYPIDILKIDKSFLDELSNNEHNSKIVKAIIALARSLELRVVAEGVESKAIQEAIKNLGVNSFQGFCISKPIPMNDVLKLLKKHA